MSKVGKWIPLLLSLGFIAGCKNAPEHFEKFTGTVQVLPPQSFVVQGHSISDGDVQGDMQPFGPASLQMTLTLPGQTPFSLQISDGDLDEGRGIFNVSPQGPQHPWRVYGIIRPFRRDSRLVYYSVPHRYFRTYRPHVYYGPPAYYRRHIGIYQMRAKVRIFDPRLGREVACLTLVGPDFERDDGSEEIEAQIYRQESGMSLWE